MLAASELEGLIAVLVTAIVVFAFVGALANTLSRRHQIQQQAEQRQREAEQRLHETGTRAARKKWTGACAGLADSWGMNRTAVRWLFVIFTVATYIVPGCVAYLLLVWKGPRPLEHVDEPADVIYKGVCARIADRYGWHRTTFRTIYGCATALNLFLPGFALYHVLRLAQANDPGAPKDARPSQARKRTANAISPAKIRLQCPHCNSKLLVSKSASGKRVRCRKCSEPITIPPVVQ